MKIKWDKTDKSPWCRVDRKICYFFVLEVNSQLRKRTQEPKIVEILRSNAIEARHHLERRFRVPGTWKTNLCTAVAREGGGTLLLSALLRTQG